MTTIMSLSQQYILASRAKRKLLSAANQSGGKDHELRVLVGHANLLDRLSESISKFDSLLSLNSYEESHVIHEEEEDEEFYEDGEDEYSSSDSEDEDTQPLVSSKISSLSPYNRVRDTHSSSGKDAQESEQDSAVSSSSDEEESTSDSDYDESNARSRYLATLQDMQDESEDEEPNYILSTHPILYKCPSQNLTLSSVSVNLTSGTSNDLLHNDESRVTTLVLSDDESENELEEDLGTLSPVYVL